MCFYMFIRPFMDIPFVFFLLVENPVNRKPNVKTWASTDCFFFFLGEVHKKKISKNTFKMLEECMLGKSYFIKNHMANLLRLFLHGFNSSVVAELAGRNMKSANKNVYTLDVKQIGLVKSWSKRVSPEAESRITPIRLTHKGVGAFEGFEGSTLLEIGCFMWPAHRWSVINGAFQCEMRN